MADKKINPTGDDFLQKIENFLSARSQMFFGICMGLTALLGFLLFDGRLSFATDDSTYILNALSFLKRGAYPNYQGALYPLVLAFIIKIFGVRILVFKTFSMICLLVGNFFFYRAFRGRVPNLIMFSGLMVLSVNAYILAYGSSTFSEAFFMMLQSLSFFAFFKLTDILNDKDSKYNFLGTVQYWLFFAISLFLLSLAKNLGVFAIIAVMVYFLLRKEWKFAILAIVFFAVIKLPYEVIIRSKYGNIGGSQVEQLMRKDFYDPSKGNIEIPGDLFDRYYENFANYCTVHAFKILGMREAGVSSLFTDEKMLEIKMAQDPNTGQPIQENENPSGFFALVFIGLFGLGIWQAFKHNKYMLFTLLYTGTLASVTFVVLQSSWNQDRLIVIFTPMIFMAFGYGIYQLAKERNITALKTILPILLAIILVIQLGFSLKAVAKNSRQFKAYTKGDLYAGYPDNKANFLRASEWAGTNANDSTSILSAQPVEAAIFAAGRSFTRMPALSKEQQNGDSILAIFHRRKIGYIMIDGFRGKNLAQVTQFLQQQFPDKIKPIHSEGEGEDATYLVKINY